MRTVQHETHWKFETPRLSKEPVVESTAVVSCTGHVHMLVVKVLHFWRFSSHNSSHFQLRSFLYRRLQTVHNVSYRFTISGKQRCCAERMSILKQSKVMHLEMTLAAKTASWLFMPYDSMYFLEILADIGSGTPCDRNMTRSLIRIMFRFLSCFLSFQTSRCYL